MSLGYRKANNVEAAMIRITFKPTLVEDDLVFLKVK
jgi:hypothetical protein